MIVLDACLIIALLNSAERGHDTARRLIAEADDFLVHPVNLAEVLVLAERHGMGAALVDDLAGLGIRSASIDDQEPLRLARLRVATGLKLPDCCALGLAQACGAPLATFDAALIRAARALDVPILPTP